MIPEHRDEEEAPATVDLQVEGLIPHEPSPPTQRYQFVRNFAEKGGQAEAILAFDTVLARHVVLKRYHGWRGGSEGESEEGRALAKIQSPFVARCYSIDRIDNETYLVVEYIPGRNLAEIQRDGPLSLGTIVRIVEQLAEGVAAVNARGLIHRDIKPENVILHDDGKPRLVDFGLAAHLGSGRLRDLSGTPSYMAPEQARGEWDRIDIRVDVYGLGAVLYRLLTDRPPHGGSTVSETLEKARIGQVAPPRSIDPKIPGRIEAVCLKALSPAPENRHAGAAEFAADLRQALAVRSTWSRRGLIAAGIGALALAAIWLKPERGKTATPDASSIEVPPTNEPVRVEIDIEHFRDQKGGKLALISGKISEAMGDGNPPRVEDLVRVTVRLSRPAHGYLIALNPDGKDQFCCAIGEPGSTGSGTSFGFPEDKRDYFQLTDGAGLQAFVVVLSPRPLPEYKTWRSRISGGLEWNATDRGGYWTYDSTESSVSDQLVGRFRGDIVRRQAEPTVFAVLDRLKRAPGISQVRAVAFPVQPGRVAPG